MKISFIYLLLVLCLAGCNKQPARHEVKSCDAVTESNIKKQADTFEATVDSSAVKERIDTVVIAKPEKVKKDTMAAAKAETKKADTAAVRQKKPKERKNTGKSADKYSVPEGVVLKLDTTVLKLPIKKSDAYIMHFLNYSDSLYQFGSYCHVQKLEGDRWVVQKFPQRIIEEARAVWLYPKRGKQMWFVPALVCGNYTPGRYRVVQVLHRPKSDEKLAVYAEFVVVK